MATFSGLLPDIENFYQIHPDQVQVARLCVLNLCTLLAVFVVSAPVQLISSPPLPHALLHTALLEVFLSFAPFF